MLITYTSLFTDYDQLFFCTAFNCVDDGTTGSRFSRTVWRTLNGNVYRYLWLSS